MQNASWLLLVAGGTAYALGNVGWGLWPLGFVCLVPLWRALIIDTHSTLSRGLRLGLVYGLVTYVVGFTWLFALAGHFIDSISGATALWLAYGLWFALGFGLYGLCCQWLLRQAIPTWVSLSTPLLLLEAVQVSLFPTYLGAGLVHQDNLAQLASLGGPPLLSALVIAVNWQVFRLSDNPKRSVLYLIGILALLGASYLHGTLASIPLHSKVAADPVHFGVVQNNVVQATQDSAHGDDAFDRKTHARNLALSRELLATQPIDVLVWPESAYSRALRRPLPLDAQFIRRDINVPLLFGGTSNFHYRGRAASANSLFLSDHQGRIDQAYDKQLLLPFAERVPEPEVLASLLGWLPQRQVNQWRANYHDWIGRLFPWHQDFQPGPGRSSLSLAGLNMATPICFEMVHPDYVRQLVRNGNANIIVSIANDAWFGDNQEPGIHLSMARLRAIEHGLWLVRATNSGYSAIIDPHGRIVAKSGLFVEQTLSAQVFPLSAITLYRRMGNWVAYLACALLGVLLLRRLILASDRKGFLAANR